MSELCTYGRPGDLADYPGHLGFPCPPMETIANHMLDIVSDQDFLKTGDATVIDCTRRAFEESLEKYVNPVVSVAWSTHVEGCSDDNRSRWTGEE
jgi:hypothetical protein